MEKVKIRVAYVWDARLGYAKSDMSLADIVKGDHHCLEVIFPAIGLAETDDPLQGAIFTMPPVVSQTP